MNRSVNRLNAYPVIQAVIAAALFGASVPVAKVFLAEIEPVTLAGFLYLGSGIGLSLYKAGQRIRHDSRGREARLDRKDIPWLVISILAGGVAGPIVLMFSLRGTPAATASLLLNFEIVATTLIASFVFREAIGRRVWLAIACIVVASILLSWREGGDWGFSLSAIGVLGACALWGVDNNVTRIISAKDPISIVATKGISAGGISLALTLIMRSPLPDFKVVLGAMLLGFFSYGLSLVFFIRAMRNLGTARASAFFGTAPFIGGALSFLLFRETPAFLFYVALPVMVIGAALILREKHVHEHYHMAIEHEHGHSHDDEHHTHKHAEETLPSNLYHSHRHRHEDTKHLHPHKPDIHHRHRHESL